MPPTARRSSRARPRSRSRSPGPAQRARSRTPPSRSASSSKPGIQFHKDTKAGQESPPAGDDEAAVAAIEAALAGKPAPAPAPTAQPVRQPAMHPAPAFKASLRAPAQVREERQLVDAELSVDHSGSDSDDMFATGDDDVLPSNVDALSEAVDTTAAAVAERVAMGKVQVNVAAGGHALERDDAEGYLHVHVGEALDDAGRYKIVGIIGRGVFSSVAMATDQVDGSSVAIKILRANTTMRKAGEHEQKLLEHVVACGQKSGAGSAHVVRLLGAFDARGHLCLVFEAMTCSLKELLDSVGQKRGLSFGAVRALTQQLLLGLGALHAAGVVHADLKPQNCLVLRSSHGVLAKIADLGSGFRLTDPENVPAPYLVSRWYRAPEVILGCEHSPALDMWSLACVVYELYTGETLFTGADNNDMLLQQQRMLGRFPKRMARRNLQAAATAGVREHFSAVDHRFLHATILPGGGSATQAMALPEKAAPGCSIAERLAGRHDSAASTADTQALVAFLSALLAADPARRLTVQQALAHPFIISTGVAFAPRAAASVAQARA